MAYTVLLVEDWRKAAHINGTQEPGRHKLQAVACCQQMLGLQHRGRRPDTIINFIPEKCRDHKYDEWFRECVIPAVSKTGLIIDAVK